MDETANLTLSQHGSFKEKAETIQSLSNEKKNNNRNTDAVNFSATKTQFLYVIKFELIYLEKKTLKLEFLCKKRNGYVEERKGTNFSLPHLAQIDRLTSKRRERHI